MAISRPTSNTISNRAIEIMAEQAVFTAHTGDQARQEYMKRRANRDELTQGFSWDVSFDGDRMRAGLGTGPLGPAFGRSGDSTDTLHFDNDVLGSSRTYGKRPDELQSGFTDGNQGFEPSPGNPLQLENADYQRLWGRFVERFVFRYFPGFALTEAEIDKTWFRGSSKALESACGDLATQIDLVLAREARIGGSDALPPVSPGNTDFNLTTEDGQRNVRVHLTARRLGWISPRLFSTGWTNVNPMSFKMFASPASLVDLSTVAKINRLPEAMEASIMQKGYMGTYANVSFVQTNHIQPHECGGRIGFYVDAIDSTNKLGAIYGSTNSRHADRRFRNALGDFSGANSATNASAQYAYTCLVNGADGSSSDRVVATRQHTPDAVIADGASNANFLNEQRLVVDGLSASTGDFHAGDHFVIDGVWAVNRTTYKPVRHLQVFTVIQDATATVASTSGMGLRIHPRIVSGGAHQNVAIEAASGPGGAATGDTSPTAGNLDNRRIQFFGREGARYEQYFGYDKDLLQTTYELVINNPRGAEGGSSEPIHGVDVSTKAIKENGLMMSVVRDFDIDAAQTKTRLDMAFSARTVRGYTKALALYGEEIGSSTAASFGV